MHWWPTDKPSLIYSKYAGDIDFDATFGPCVDRLTKRKDRWREAVKDCPTPYQFLKENFYD
jgi:hypothetical protein